MHHDDDRMNIEPAPRPSLLAVLAELSAIDEEPPGVDDPPPAPVDL